MLIISGKTFPDMTLVIEYSALIPLLFSLARMAILFDEILESLLGSLGYRHV
jgi:hypothetical protein